ncbi:hypothetical protein BDK51DRAFT_38371, partial [Blyttiomyces helicus]
MAGKEDDPSSWSYLVSRPEISSSVNALSESPDPYFIYASMVPEHSLDFPSPSSGPLTTGLLGMCVLHRASPPLPYHPQDALRSTVIFLEIPSLIVRGECTLPTAGEDRNWNWRVLRHMDKDADFFVMAEEEDDETQRWDRLQFWRLSDCCAADDAASEPPDSSSTLISEFVMPDDLIGCAICPCPTRPSTLHPTSRPFNPQSTTLVLSISETAAGICLFIDRNSGSLITRTEYGSNVTIIDLGNPHDSLVLTGHVDGRVKIWDFASTSMLVDVVDPAMAGPILGLAWMDEPDNWASGAWARPRGATLVAYSDVDGEEEEEGVGEFVVWDLAAP